MKFLTWNIWSGGFEDYSYDLEKPKRLPLIQEVVKDVNADFVSLIDTFRWESHFSKQELKDLFGYEYVYCINLEDDRLKDSGHNNGITVLTRTPNPHFETIRIATRNAVKTSLSYNDAKIHVFSLYLDDLKEDTRLQQFDSLVEYINDPTRTILTGDFNSIPKSDTPETRKRIDSMYSRYPHIKKKYDDHLDDMLRGELPDRIADIHLRDCSKDLAPTTPTPAFLPGGAVLRWDQTHVGKNIQASSLQVLVNDLTDQASDHYPIVFEIE